MMATAMRAAMRPYSIAVTPLSSRTKLMRAMLHILGVGLQWPLHLASTMRRLSDRFLAADRTFFDLRHGTGKNRVVTAICAARKISPVVRVPRMPGAGRRDGAPPPVDPAGDDPRRTSEPGERRRRTGLVAA